MPEETFEDSFYKMILTPRGIYLIGACLLVLLFLFFYVCDPFHTATKDPLGAAGTIFTFTFLVVAYASWAAGKDASAPANYGARWQEGKREIWNSILYVAILWGVSGWFLKTSKLGVATFSKLPSWALIGGHLLTMLAIIIVLVLIVFLFHKSITEADGGPGQTWLQTLIALLKGTILYLPCLIADCIALSKKEWKDNPVVVWLVLGLEAIFIGGYFLLPKLITYLEYKDTKQLLPEPVYLAYETQLGFVQPQVHARRLEEAKERRQKRDMHSTALMSRGERQFVAGWNGFVTSLKNAFNPGNITASDYALTYSVSLWFRINPQPVNGKSSYTSFANILSYGNQPRIEYNMVMRTLRVRTVLDGSKQMLIAESDNIPLQRWNYLVVNYDGATMDVILNGKLVGSKPNVAMCLNENARVIAGQQSGLEGGIVNVRFKPKPLGLNEIKSTYANLVDVNPPAS